MNFLRTLTSGAMVGVLSVHALEDIALLTVGKYAPIPTPAMYAVGLGLSWIVFGLLLTKILPHKH
jgi:hypothetical protein